MATIFCLIIAMYVATSLPDPRIEEFSRIKNYELIYLNTNLLETTNIIEFHAFNQYYKISLLPNHDMIASNIRHANVNPVTISPNPDPYFTSLTQTCHYFGTVLNTNKTSKVSLSLCNKRGIRGRIVAFDETLIIQPSAYYLDRDKDKYGSHHLNDEHLVYKLSDINSTNLSHAITQSILSNNKRRMLQNNGVHNIETLIVNDPFRTFQYQFDYGDQWYEQMVSDYADVINLISNEYSTTDWGTDVGEIRVHFVELEVIFEYEGKYSSLWPVYGDAECRWSEFYCTIDAQRWLLQFIKWLNSYKSKSSYDYAHLVTNARFTPYGWSGLGITGSICQGPQSSGIGMAFEGLTRLTRTIAHELGHALGMYHDGEHPAEFGYECPYSGSGAGIMGGEMEGWSNCSIKDLQSLFSTEDLSCLGTTVRNFTTNYIPEDIASTTSEPDTTMQTIQSTNSSMHIETICILMTGFDRINTSNNYTFDGEWWKIGNHLDNIVYSKDEYYLYYNHSMWLIGTRIDVSDLIGYCANADIEQCSAEFKLKINDEYMLQNNSDIYSCNPTDSDSDDDEWDCIQLYGFNNDVADGYWNEMDDNKYYKDGYYLYFMQQYPAWFMGTSTGQTYPDSSIVGLCWYADIKDCGSGNLRVMDSNSVLRTKVNSMVGRCDYSPGINYTCIYHECLAIYGLPNARGDINFNGIWKPGGCHNGHSFYILNGCQEWETSCGETRYLFYSAMHWVWMIADSFWSQIAYAYCPKGILMTHKNGTLDIMDTDSGWYVRTDVGWEWLITSVEFAECGAFMNQELDLRCANHIGYKDKLCMDGFSNNTSWNYTFEVYTKLCSENKPIYYVKVYNDSDSIDGRDAFGNVKIEETYYLYYVIDYMYEDSDKTVGKWILSEGQVSLRGFAFCEKEDLLECTANTWMMERDEDDGSITYIVDEYMAVSNGECGYMPSSKHGFQHYGELLFIVVCGVLVIIIIVGGCCIWHSNNKKKMIKTMDTMGMYVNEKCQSQYDDELQEIEIGTVVNGRDSTNNE